MLTGWVALLAMAGACASALAVQPSSAPTRSAHADPWNEALAAFAAADVKQAPPSGGVLFVGSSSIRLWDNLESDFDDARVVKRGFGGSRLSDCVRHLDRLVINYRPRLVMLYAGDNDLAEGGMPQTILDRFKEFTQGVHRRLPDTRVAFISIKPSPARRALISRARAANQLVREYADAHPGVEYIDVFTPMLGADGSPRRDLFRTDDLHLNEAGYALWRSLIRPFVR
jgi:lysophospholipase L1-like esterase